MTNMKQQTISILAATMAVSLAFTPAQHHSLQRSVILEYAKDRDILVPEFLDPPIKHRSQNSSQSSEEIVQTIAHATLSKHDLNWQKRMDEIIEFHAIHGHSDVPYNYPDKGLSRWVTNQRQKWKKHASSMTPERINALNSLDFKWEPRSAWDTRFSELKAFYESNGHLNIDQDPNLETSDLAKFISTLRHQYSLKELGKNGDLSDEQVNALNSIDFQFEYTASPNTASDKKWEEQFMALQEYKKEHGNCKVPQNYKQNPKLGLFVKNQRTQYKLMKSGKNSSMKSERLRKLEAIGFIWNTRQYNPIHPPSSLLRIPVEEVLRRSHAKRRGQLRKVEPGLEENAELLLQSYGRKSEWGML